jgi:hypothetical protein
MDLAGPTRRRQESRKQHDLVRQLRGISCARTQSARGEERRAQFWVIGVSAPAVVTGTDFILC